MVGAGRAGHVAAAPVCCTLDGQHGPGPGPLKKDAAAAQGQIPPSLQNGKKGPFSIPFLEQSMTDIAGKGWHRMETL